MRDPGEVKDLAYSRKYNQNKLGDLEVFKILSSSVSKSEISFFKISRTDIPFGNSVYNDIESIS